MFSTFSWLDLFELGPVIQATLDKFGWLTAHADRSNPASVWCEERPS